MRHHILILRAYFLMNRKQRNNGMPFTKQRPDCSRTHMLGVWWKTDVVPNFDQLPPLEKPWRWEQENANRGLGQWLLRVREQIQSGKDVLLQHAPAVWK